MAYSGSTAASSAANPPMMIGPSAIGGRFAANSTSVYAGARLWFYNSSDGSTVLQGAGYFTDGKKLGMRVGDVLLAVCAATQSSTDHILVAGILVTTDSTAGWNLSTGGTMTSTFN